MAITPPKNTRKRSYAEQERLSRGTDLEVIMNIDKQFDRMTAGQVKRNTADSMKWFSRYIPKSYNNVYTSVMFRDRNLWAKKLTIGKMYFFEYDAIHKDKLPVWDRYPLVFPIDSHKANGHSYMLGLNMHYLPPRLRCEVMLQLLKLRNEKRYRQSTRLQLTWEVLKSMGNSKLFEHCVKLYRLDAVKSVFVNVPSQAWEQVVFLPTARWQHGKLVDPKDPWSIK